jgi:hypothetical protein
MSTELKRSVTKLMQQLFVGRKYVIYSRLTVAVSSAVVLADFFLYLKISTLPW